MDVTRQALQLKQLPKVKIPSERTVYRVMKTIGLSHKPNKKPNSLTKADKKAVTDITKIRCFDGNLYVSAIIDCFDLQILGLSMDTNMKATLCEKTIEGTYL